MIAGRGPKLHAQRFRDSRRSRTRTALGHSCPEPHAQRFKDSHSGHAHDRRPRPDVARAALQGFAQRARA